MSRFAPDLDLQHRLVKRSIIMLTVVFVISLLSFAGWMFSVEWLKHPISGLVAMNPLTSLCFVGLVIALRFKLKYKGKRSHGAFADSIAVIVLVITFSKLLALAAGWDYSLDQLIFFNEVNSDTVSGFTNRMAPNTALCFGLLAVGVLFFHKLQRFFLIAAQTATVLVLMVAVFSILGYIFGAKEFYEVQNYIPMALSSGICFFLFSLAILFASPGTGIMQQLTSKYSGSFIAWRLFLPAFILPVLIGLFRLWGQRSGLYNLEFGSALFVTSMILFFLSLIWVNTLLLNRREQSQEEIIAEKNYMANLVEQTSDAILSTDPYLNIMSWNNGAEEIYGYKKEEVMGKPLGSFLKSTLDPETSEKLLADLNKRGYYNAEYIFFNKQQQPVNVQASVTVLKNQEHQITGYVAVHRDISERKQLEKQLKEFNNQLEIQVKEKTAELRDVFERISDAFIGVDNDYNVVYINKRAELLFNISSDQLTNTSVYKLFSTTEGEVERAIKETFISREYVYLETWLAQFQKWFELNVYPSPSGLSIYIRDITIRKKALLELNASEEKYRLFFENSMDGILLTDGKGQIFSANKAATEIFGMTEEEICSGGRPAILDETDPNWPKFFDARNRYGKAQGELRHFRKNGSTFLAEITSVKFKNASGEEQTNTIIRDITERKRAEEDLNESYQQIRRLTAYLQKVREDERAHIAREIHDELGQQLTVMKMDVSWMKKKIKNGDVNAVPAKMDELQEILDGTVSTVRRIATDLRPSLLDDIGLIAAIEWEVDMFTKRTGIKVNLSKPESAVTMPDESVTGLFRILQESLTNIIRHASASQVDIHLENQNNDFILYIEDNGKGFDMNTVAGKKTLGLLGMKERSAMMRGIFTINSEPLKGTKLEVRVPLS
ncbi:PAS domain-containing sensor histidine kinase [Lacibacter sediminis]|uniref:PAS domain S-box protein n=1 Tax=Lacibacter sediminis TaxID=2760713 RepID=A0A7G5XII1_9BACT|nr:PAS domain S-box protein [Lacibacter sediminis]QNA45284.1 PAS domain S-box protein [Lacibacter sediminis]